MSVWFFSYSQSSEWQQSIAFAYISPDIQVNMLPLEIRTVPIHPNDSNVPDSNAGPIAQQRFTIDGSLYFEWRVKKTIKSRGFYAGIALRWIVYPTAALYNNALRNYSNAVGSQQRGVGAALTFVGLEKRGPLPDIDSDTWDDLLLNISPELFIENKFLSTDLYLVTAISYYRLQAVTGWDRDDALEEKDHFTLAHVVPISLAIQSNQIKLGISVPVVVAKTDYGKNAGIITTPALLFVYQW